MMFSVLGYGFCAAKIGKRVGVVAAGTAALWLSGCGMGVSAGPTANSPAVKLTGRAIGGQQPINGAQIYLFKAGTTGYGSNATSILSQTLSAANHPGGSNVTLNSTAGSAYVNDYYVKTDTNGNFDLTGDYSCSAGDEVYALAVGGNPGNSNGDTNSAIALMTGLGDCTFLQTNAGNLFISINEITTVASVYALQQFMVSATEFTSGNVTGINANAPTATHLGTSAASGVTGGLPGNAVGLQAAMAMINNLVDVATGTSPGVGQPTSGGGYTTLPSYETMNIPVQTINSLANILAYCVNTDPAVDNTHCTTLFTNSKSSTTSVTTPTDTVQAIFNIAQNPWANVAALYALVPAYPQWGNYLGSAPNDWSLPVQVTGGGIWSATIPAIDSQGNIWLPNTGNGSTVTKISPTGAILSGSTGFASGPSPWQFAIDASDGVWMANTFAGSGSLSYMSNAGVLQTNAASSTAFTGCGVGADGASVNHGLALDASGHVWESVYSVNSGASSSVASLNEFSSANDATFGTCISGPLDNGGVTTASGPNSVTFDHAGNIWVANRLTNTVVQLTSTGTAGTSYAKTSSPNLNAPFNVSIDALGNAWASGFGGNNLIKIVNPTATTSPGLISGYTATSGGQGIAYAMVDGLDNIWTANFTPGCVSKFSDGGTSQTAVCLGKTTIPASGPHGLAVDTAGNLWVGITGQPTVGVYFLVGAAAPTVNPIVTATVNNHLGVRP